MMYVGSVDRFSYAKLQRHAKKMTDQARARNSPDFRNQQRSVSKLDSSETSDVDNEIDGTATEMVEDTNFISETLHTLYQKQLVQEKVTKISQTLVIALGLQTESY